MYKVYDYECEICDAKDDRLVRDERKDNQRCKLCDQCMVRLPAAPITTFKHNDTKLKR